MKREDTALVFPGQGSQYVGMGKNLYDDFEVARRVFEEVDDGVNQKLSELIFNGNKDDLNLTENTQTGIMAVSVAAYRVLAAEKGIKSLAEICKVTAGHSLGEYSALCAAGSISLTDTAKLLKARGKAMQEAVPVGKGGMLALLGVNYETAQQIATAGEKHGVCQVANDNCSGQVVISGDLIALEEVEKFASEYGCKRAIRLPVSAPFHCRLMGPAANVMQDELAKVQIFNPSVPIIANYTAKPNLSSEAVLGLLVNQIPNRVRWNESINLMSEEYKIKNFIEVGPGKILTGLIGRILEGVSCTSFEKSSDLNNIQICQ